MRFSLHSLARWVLQLAIALLVLLALGGLFLFTVYCFFPNASIPYLLPAQKVTEDTVFYHRSWREPFEYDIKVYASQSATVTAHNTASFFESAQLLWHVESQSLEKKYPKYRTKISVKIPESMLNETMWGTSSIYAHVFIQRSNQFTPYPNATDPYLVYISTGLVSTAVSYDNNTRAYSMLNGTSYTLGRKRAITCPSLLAWDIVLEDHTYTEEALPKVFRQSISDYPDKESKTGTYNPPLIYRPASESLTMTAVPAEGIPKPTNSNGRSSSPANTARTMSPDVELKIQGISQGWVRGEDVIMMLVEPKVERKTMTSSRRPQYYQSESNMAHGNIHSGRFGSARPTATASSGNIGSARLSNNDMGGYEGYKNEVVVSAPENVGEVVYTTYTTSTESDVYENASVLSIFLVLVSLPLVAALLLTAFGSIAAFWSREDTKWEGTSRLTVVLEVMYQCGNLVLLHTSYTIVETDALLYLYAGLSIWAIAALYNVPLNPFMWRRRLFSLHAPPSSEIAKLVLAGNDDSSSTTTRVSELSRVRGRKLAASIQQEVDQLLKRWFLWLGIPFLVLYFVYAAVTSRECTRRFKLIDAASSILHAIRAFQLLPQVVINYRTKSVAWIPITAYMCELLVNIYRMLVGWASGSPAFFASVLAGANWLYCLLLVVFAVQWAKYYKAKQD